MYQCDNQEEIENQTPIGRTEYEKNVKFTKTGDRGIIVKFLNFPIFTDFVKSNAFVKRGNEN